MKIILASKSGVRKMILDKHKIDILISGGDYKNRKFKTKTINFNRTSSVSSTMLRKKSAKILKNKNEK